MARSTSQHLEPAQDVDLQAELTSSRARIVELEAEIDGLRELIDGDPRHKLELALYFVLGRLKPIEELVPPETLRIMQFLKPAGTDFVEAYRKALDEMHWRRHLWAHSAASVRAWCVTLAEVAQAAADPQVGVEEFERVLRK